MGFLQLGLGGGALDCFSHIRQAPAHEHVNEKEEDEEEEEDQGSNPATYGSAGSDFYLRG